MQCLMPILLENSTMRQCRKLDYIESVIGIKLYGVSHKKKAPIEGAFFYKGD